MSDNAPIQYDVIITAKCVYIQTGKNKNNYGLPMIEYLLFDGAAAEKTYQNNWFKLSVLPTKIQRKLPNKQINIRYELKDGYTPSDIMPKTIVVDKLGEEYEEVSGLYKRAYDEEDGGYEDIKFEINVIYDKEDFSFVENKLYAENYLLDKIQYHPSVLCDKPCFVASEQMYSIIRNHVKLHIDKRYADISSDYDFHFEVVKKILLADPYQYSYDENKGDKRRKPRWVTKNITDKKQTILNLKNKSSSSDYGKDCVLAPSICGINYLDLEKKVSEYLEDLMREINKDYKECSHCMGWGIISEEDIQNG